MASAVLGIEQSGERGELPGGIAPPLPCGQGDCAREQLDRCSILSGNGDPQERLDDRHGRCGIVYGLQVIAKQTKQQCIDMRACRAKDRGPHPRLVSIASRHFGECLARSRFVVVSHRQCNLETNMVVCVVGESKQGVGHNAGSPDQRPYRRDHALANSGIGVIEASQGRGLVEAAKINQGPDRLDARLGPYGGDRQCL